MVFVSWSDAMSSASVAPSSRRKAAHELGLLGCQNPSVRGVGAFPPVGMWCGQAFDYRRLNSCSTELVCVSTLGFMQSLDGRA